MLSDKDEYMLRRSLELYRDMEANAATIAVQLQRGLDYLSAIHSFERFDSLLKEYFGDTTRYEIPMKFTSNDYGIPIEIDYSIHQEMDMPF